MNKTKCEFCKHYLRVKTYRTAECRDGGTCLHPIIDYIADEDLSIIKSIYVSVNRDNGLLRWKHRSNKLVDPEPSTYCGPQYKFFEVKHEPSYKFWNAMNNA